MEYKDKKVEFQRRNALVNIKKSEITTLDDKRKKIFLDIIDIGYHLCLVLFEKTLKIN